MSKSRVIIMGAAGRDFHNFNTYFRDNESYEVVGFTAAQIPNISDRKYPAELAGKLYPNGIMIHPESDLVSLIHKEKVEQVVFAYSDISHIDLMHKASLVLANGADFRLMGNPAITLQSSKPVISVCAVRTGAGKSQTTRKICRFLKKKGLSVVAVRHPMPYGDLVKQAVQRFATYDDLDKNECTIEEREEYEPLIDNGIVVYAGVDYEKILREAEKESDVIVWDGGNNDTSFYRSNLHIVIADPHRPGHEMTLPSRRDERAHGRRRGHQQGEHRRPEGHPDREGEHPETEPGRHDHRGGIADQGGRSVDDPGQEGAGGGGRADRHARRHGLRRRDDRRRGQRGGGTGRSAEDTPSVRSPRRSRSSRTWGRYCRRWATGKRRCTSWRRRSTTPIATWSSPARPST